MRGEAWQWFPTQAAENTYGFGHSTWRFGVSQSRENLDWQAEAEQVTVFAAPDDAIASGVQGALGMGANYFQSNGSNSAGIFPKQVFVRFHSSGRLGQSLKLGRFEFIEGQETAPSNATLAMLKRDRIAHRLVGNFGFSAVGRSFDGAQYVFNRSEWNFTAMAGRATQGVFNTNGLKELATAIAYAAFTRPVFKKSSELRVFGIEYHDGRLVTKTDNRSLAMRQADTGSVGMGTVGANFIGTRNVLSGTADALLWGAWQFGDWGALTQKSAALAAEAGYQFAARTKPWLRVGYFRGTGDKNPNDNTHGTFFQMLPTPRISARMPFFNLMNNEDIFAEFMLQPAKKVILRSDAHVLRLSSANDLWYQGGGAYDNINFGFSGRPSSGTRGLANLYDLSADHQLSKQVTLTAYIGLAQGKNTIAKIYPQRNTARFGCLELLYKF